MMDTTVKDKEQSISISCALDHIGYNQDSIKYRKSLYLKSLEYLNRISSNKSHVLYMTGSTAEGVSVLNESDYDCIVVNQQVGCLLSFGGPRLDGRHVVYECETVDTAPGYIRLKLAPGIHDSDSVMLNNAEFLNSTVDSYLYNKRYVQNMVSQPRSPKYPLDLITGFWNIKNTNIEFPLPIYDTREIILADFEQRRSTFGWPLPNIIQEIDSDKLRSYVYPVGHELSDSAEIEWRISHTEVEQIMMDKMNETQIKVYILLKLIVKPVLGGRQAGMTSYILKNLLFWTCQNLPMASFTTDQLVPCLMFALWMLYEFVKCGHMPCYMIPERNLFPRLSVSTKSKWLQTLSELRQQRAAMVLNHDKLRDVMILKLMKSDVLNSYTEKRESIERIFLMLIKLKAEMIAHGESETVKSSVQAMTETIFNIVLPDWRVRSERGEDINTILCSRLAQFSLFS